jgi:hypothetical protein
MARETRYYVYAKNNRGQWKRRLGPKHPSGFPVTEQSGKAWIDAAKKSGMDLKLVRVIEFQDVIYEA